MRPSDLLQLWIELRDQEITRFAAPIPPLLDQQR
jgi:hypothetical protein